MNRRKFIKNGIVAGVGISALGGLNCFGIKSTSVKRVSVLFKGATIIDGSGANRKTADLLIESGKIAGIGRFNPGISTRVIDADGLVLAPGFIDIHSHTDLSLFVNPNAESKIRQGVTTEIVGQDGDSVAPLNAEMSDTMHGRHKERFGIDIDWTSMDEALSKFENNGIGINLATCVGLGTVRENVIGLNDRRPTEAELSQMRKLIDESLRAGAVGVSTGLEYTPGSFAETDELIELSKIAANYGVPYFSHIRNEDETLIEAVEEAIRIGREAGVAVNISHLKVSGATNWHKIDELLQVIDDANAEGLRVTMDRYSYIAYHTGLANLFPLWSREGGWNHFKERLTDPAKKDSIRNLYR